METVYEIAWNKELEGNRNILFSFILVFHDFTDLKFGKTARFQYQQNRYSHG